MKVQKKGQLDNFGGLIQTLGFMAILIAVVFLVVGQMQDQAIEIENATGDGVDYAYNATATIQSSLADIPAWFPVIVITVIGTILLGLIQFFRRK